MNKIYFEINRINNNDLKNIEQIGKSCLPIYHDNNALNYLLPNKRYILYKAYNNENIFGFIIAEIKDSKRIHVQSLAVLEKYRRNYIGKKLIMQIKKYHSREISLYVLKNNINAIKFYKKENFKIIKTLENHYDSLSYKAAYYMCYFRDQKKSKNQILI